MKSRKLHKIIGLILVLPMLGWTITGVVFFIKPGYQAAYEQLAVKTYVLDDSLVIKPKHHWQEVKLVKTILGVHLLVKSHNKIEHLDAVSLNPKVLPSEVQFQQLLTDAFTSNNIRYGEIESIKGLSAKTNTGIEVKLDWNNLKLSQKGQDTHLINLLYKVHYLQWTPHKELNQVLGVFGLILLMLLTALGIKLYIKQ